MNTSFQGTSEKGTNVWITPQIYIDALGPFDLDPCANVVMPWPTANTMLTIKEDGLETSWDGYARVWMNPPYNRTGMQKWFTKIKNHNNGIALVFSSTDVDWFDYVWDSEAQLFKKGRINFLNEFGQLPVNEKGEVSGSGKGSVFAAWGEENCQKLHDANKSGIITGKFQYTVSGKKQEKATLFDAQY